MTDLPCSPYLRQEPRTEAEVLADRLDRADSIMLAGPWLCDHTLSDAHKSLIIRALRAYKPAPVTDTHHQFDGGE